ncbi:MAG: hypothetical protein ACYC0F_15040 [Rhodanobacter sp.]
MKTDYAAQCRFFRAEDAVRIALQAYYAAGRRIEPPPGEPWMIDGDPYATATDFAEAFNGELQARLSLLALARLGDFNVLRTEWDLCMLAADVEPEKMAPIIARRETERLEIEAEFSGLKMHDLPPEDNAVHNRLTEGSGHGR